MHNGDFLRQRGFGYLLALFALAAMGLLLAGAGQVWHTVAMRDKEAELVFVGNQFRQAIGAYYEGAPGMAKQFPARLEDLLEDRRFPIPRRHLRKIFIDPMTGNDEWGLDVAGSRIVGVHSLSRDRPFRTDFSGRDVGLAKAASYDAWHFVYEPGNLPDAGSGGRTVPPAAPLDGGAPQPSGQEQRTGESAVSPTRLDECSPAHLSDMRACDIALHGLPGLRACGLSAAARLAACIAGRPLPALALP